MTKMTTMKILLIEDNPGDARLVREMLQEDTGHRYSVVHAWSLSDALDRLGEVQFDVALVDLTLPDAHGLCTVTHLQNAAPKLPIVILSGTDDESLALQAVQQGAQDYLVKGLGDSYLLSRSLNYAIERKERQAQLLYLAQYDQLTGLPNRQLFHDRLDGALRRAQHHGHMVALLFIDLDRFKFVNDNLGHECGDRLLKSTAQRLEGAVRAADTVARLGGDEFTVILEEIANPEDVAVIARNILQTMAEPFELDGHQLSVTTSIGIAVFPHDADEAEALIRGADRAMYHAKEQGRNDYRFIEAIHGGVNAQQSLKAGLRFAQQRDEFVIYYQPQYAIDSGKLVAMEALLRWQHPTLGLLGPERFLTLQEETGMIISVGEWVLRSACAQQRAWREAGLPAAPIAVNVSALQLKNPRFVETVAAVLNEANLAPQSLAMEITEAVLMERRGGESNALLQLKELGVRIIVDAFGTGYCSVRRLCQLGVDALKIDRGVIECLDSDRDALTVEAIIALGHAMKVEVIAMGVETQDQLTLLRNSGCDGVQGYLLAEPRSAADLLPLLQQRGTIWSNIGRMSAV